VKKIAKFAWNDETAKVKIYIDTAQFNCEVTEEMITVNYEPESVSISVTDNDGATHILKLDKTYEKIEPEKSTMRFKPNRITVSL